MTVNVLSREAAPGASAPLGSRATALGRGRAGAAGTEAGRVRRSGGCGRAGAGRGRARPGRSRRRRRGALEPAGPSGGGPLVYIVLTKGCAQATDHEARITKHNPGPGVSVISYTRVCCQDACNDLPTTLPLWDLPSPTVPRGRGGGRGGGQHLG